MDESRLLVKWKSAGADLGVEVVGPFELELPSGVRIRAPVLVRCFGAPEGMLLLTDFGLVMDLTDEILQAGYGFSIMSEPSEGEEYSRDVAVEVLADWGWTGAESDRPAWLDLVDPETS